MKPNHNINEEPNPYFFTLAEVHQLREILKGKLSEQNILVNDILSDIEYRENYGARGAFEYIKQSYSDLDKAKKKIKNYAKLQTKLKHTLVTAG